MKFIIILSIFLAFTTAEISEPTIQNLEKETPLPQEKPHDVPTELKPDTLDEQPSIPVVPVPVELQEAKARQQRHILIKSEIPTVLVPTYEIPQFYIFVDQARYAPWYYYPVVPLHEKPEPTKSQ